VAEVNGRPVVARPCPPNLEEEHFPYIDIPQFVPVSGMVPDTDRLRYFAFTTNSLGLRTSKEFTREKPPGTYRIVVVGTGVSWGLGVDDDETYAYLLEDILNQAPPADKKFEVINLARPALLTVEAEEWILYWGTKFDDIDLWLIMLGVNDSLPCFPVQLDQYMHAWRAVSTALKRQGGSVVTFVEPMNTFYPWPLNYEKYDSAMRKLVAPNFPIIDIAELLDCHELQDGLRLEEEEGKLKVVQYSKSEPAVVYEMEVGESHNEQIVPMPIYDFLDDTEYSLKTFFSDVHLNETGNRIVAEALSTVVAAHLEGRVNQLKLTEECTLK